jgi:hypothetical protein
MSKMSVITADAMMHARDMVQLRRGRPLGHTTQFGRLRALRKTRADTILLSTKYVLSGG